MIDCLGGDELEFGKLYLQAILLAQQGTQGCLGNKGMVEEIGVIRALSHLVIIIRMSLLIFGYIPNEGKKYF